MGMSTARHLLGKAMQGIALTEDEVRTIIGVIRKDERLKIFKPAVDVLLKNSADGKDVSAAIQIVELIRGKYKW